MGIVLLGRNVWLVIIKFIHNRYIRCVAETSASFVFFIATDDVDLEFSSRWHEPRPKSDWTNRMSRN